MRLRVNRGLLRNTGLVFGAAVVAGVLQYLVLVLVGRRLGPEHLGLIVLATSVASFMAASVELGIGPVLIRFRPVQDDDPVMWAAIVRSMNRVVRLVFVGLAAVAVPAAALAMRHWHGHWLTTLAFAAGIAAPTALLTYFQAYLMAFSRFGFAALLNVATAAARVIFLVALAALGHLTVSAVLSTYLVTVGIAAIAAWYVTLGRANLPTVDPETLTRARMLIKPFLRWSMVGRATVALNGRLDIFLTSALAGATTTGVYGVASQTAAPFGMLGGAVGEVSFPYLVRQERNAEGRVAIRRWFAWLPVVLVVGCLVALAGAYALPLVMGPAFDGSRAPFVALGIAYSLQVWLQPVGIFLYASDRQRRAASIAVVQTILVAGLDVILIPLYGALGPALAILVTTCVTGPWMVAAALRHRGDRHDVIEMPAGSET